ncbi:hypothetical protein [Pedobacter gandavensis]|uniref:hypothetical protein n=1 Tax=Pedobacter gandavensis TaxID=2679963 RepID=UPI00292F72C3|nr:hypothetical protein [Pedobacter gandavensis]
MERINNTYQNTLIGAYELINKAKSLAKENPEFSEELENCVNNLLYNVSPYEALENKISSFNMILKVREEMALIQAELNRNT